MSSFSASIFNVHIIIKLITYLLIINNIIFYSYQAINNTGRSLYLFIYSYKYIFKFHLIHYSYIYLLLKTYMII